MKQGKDLSKQECKDATEGRDVNTFDVNKYYPPTMPRSLGEAL